MTKKYFVVGYFRHSSFSASAASDTKAHAHNAHQTGACCLAKQACCGSCRRTHQSLSNRGRTDGRSGRSWHLGHPSSRSFSSVPSAEPRVRPAGHTPSGRSWRASCTVEPGEFSATGNATQHSTPKRPTQKAASNITAATRVIFLTTGLSSYLQCFDNQNAIEVVFLRTATVRERTNRILALLNAS